MYKINFNCSFNVVQISPPLPSNDLRASFLSCYVRAAKDLLVEVLKELWSPPSIAAV